MGSDFGLRSEGGDLFGKDDHQRRSDTPSKFNIAPENLPSQKEGSLPTIIFHGAMLNNGGVGASMTHIDPTLAKRTSTNLLDGRRCGETCWMP